MRACAQFCYRADMQVPIALGVPDPTVMRLSAAIPHHDKPIFADLIGASFGNHKTSYGERYFCSSHAMNAPGFIPQAAIQLLNDIVASAQVAQRPAELFVHRPPRPALLLCQPDPLQELQPRQRKLAILCAIANRLGRGQVDLPANLRAFITDPAGDTSYPIVTFTWWLVHAQYTKPGVADTIKALATWCLTDGQKLSPELGYLPLPAPVVTKVQAAVAQIK